MKLILNIKLLFSLTLTIFFVLFAQKTIYIPIFSELFNLIVLLVFPGMLLMPLIFNNKLRFWDWFFISIGMSLSCWILFGLLLNWIFPFFSTVAPLTTNPLIILFIILTVVPILICFIKQKDIFPYYAKEIDALSLILLLVPICFPILSFLGTNRLNSGSDNVVSFTLLLLIAAYSAILFILDFKFKKDIYPFAIFCISLSLLLMLSLRSSFISGYDIQQEYLLFSETIEKGKWIIAGSKYAYNACLSVTLFPTLVFIFTGIPKAYVFKFFFQIIFAFSPAIIYLLSLNFLSRRMSFLASLYFFQQPFFLLPMTQIARQEIAFLFYTLLVYSLFHPTLQQKQKNILFLLTGFSVVVAHYSTTYVTIFLLIFAYLLNRILRIVSLKLTFIKGTNTFLGSLKLTHIMLLGMFTFLWYSQLTQSTGNISNKIYDVARNMRNIFTKELRNEEAMRSIQLFQPATANSLELIRAYELSQKDKEQILENPAKYKAEQYNSFLLLPSSPNSIQPIFYFSSLKYLYYGLQLLKQVTKVFVVIGSLYLLVNIFKKSKKDTELILLSVGSASLIVIMLVHPTLAAYYNMSRIYLQLLVVLSISAVFGGLVLLKFLPVKLREFSILIVFLTTFVYLSGALSQIIGGEPLIHLNNNGLDYEKFYPHKGEILSATWLTKNRDYLSTVYSDTFANLRLFPEANFYGNPIILPSNMYVNSYVYGVYTNVINNRTLVNFNGQTLLYNFPKTFLESNKSIIYTNGTSIIYK